MDSTAQSAMQSALQRQLQLAQQARSVLYPFIGRSAQFQAWQHYPRNDAVCASGAWQFYYHAHDQDNRHSPGDSGQGAAWHTQEHGHIHLFRRSPQGELSHLAGLSLDARGTPLCWFACNQWVTGERWRSGAVMARGLRRLRLQLRGPLAGAALWLADLVRGYAEPLQALLLARDAALAAHCQQQNISPKQALQDRRIAVWSSFSIAWPADAVALPGRASPQPNPRRSA